MTETPHRTGGAAASSFGRADLAWAVALLIAVFAAYFPALLGGRLLDDQLHITRPELQSLSGLGRIWFEPGATQQYYPVLHTAFWLEHRLWGDAVAGYHLVNLLQHAGIACLLVLLMRRLRLPGGWLAAFLFALHPVCVESVAWIAEQKNTLSTLFAAGAALAYLRFDDDRRKSSYGLALAPFALALASKIAAASEPLVLCFLVWWRRPRIAARRDVLPLLPWVALAVAMGLVTLSVERGLLADIRAQFELGFLGRCLLAGRVFWFYLGKLVWPAGLTFFYPRWLVDSHAAAQYPYPLAAAALAAGLAWLARRRRGPLAALLCYGCALAPVLGFLDVEWFVFSFVGDHLQYFAAPCVLIPIAAWLAAAGARLSRNPARLLAGAAAAVVVVLGVLTWRQCGRYGDPETFYRTAIALNPQAGAAYNYLGEVLAARPDRTAEAIAQFERALQFNPRVAEGQENLGTILLRDPARLAEAITHLETARNLKPGKPAIHAKLALALAKVPGRQPEAIVEYRAALDIDPANADAHNGLGAILMRDPGRWRDAEAEFRMALDLKPGYAEAHNNLGDLLIKVPGRLTDAVTELEEALRLNPDLADAHNNLGLAWARMPGKLDDAIGQFREALRLKPSLAAAHINLGLALTLMPGRLKDAAAELQEGLRLDPNFAPGWHMLGQCWWRLGDLAGAAEAFRQELRLAPGNPDAQQALAAVLGQMDQR